ncbi:syntaxin binding protein 1 [Coemansia sp. RSA 1722]|nr:syntaxin binding protein 1 [Coemansia sp. RSA 485]KAJ2599639.1 syntaxin binding protein 1 [Coemansia sp. RSA 1722]
MPTNLLLNKRQEFVNALVTVRPNNRFKIVVVDKRSLAVLNDMLKLSEILEHDVFRIDKIENKRKEEPTMDALYFLTPSKQSIARLIEDFAAPSSSHGAPGGGHRGSSNSSARKQPQYRAAHIYFTSELSDPMLRMIKSAGIAPYIKALNELCIEYEAHDQYVFLTELANRPLYRMYSPLLSKGINDELELISKKLANVCCALKENPVVRYLLLDQDIYGDTKARPLAFLFHTEMERVRESLPKDQNDDGRPQTELIIIDRSADPFAPILHEFTYEAMVNDLLDIENGNKYVYTTTLADGTEEEKTVVLDDADPIWQEFRFRHISEAQEGINRKFQELMGSNKAIADMQSGQKLDVGRLRDVVSSMPQFKDQLSVLSAHIDMMEKCMEEFNKRGLEDLGLLEQNLVMGTTAGGEKYTTGDIDIAYVLNNPDIEPRDKLRALLLFFIANPSMTETERQKLAQMAKFSRESRESIRNMGMVIRWSHALDLLKQIKQKPGQAAKASKWSLSGIRGAKTQDDEEDTPFDLSRYTPGFKNVLEGSIEGNLSEDLFPYVVPPERPRDSNPFAAAGSARSTPGIGQGNDRSGSPATSMWSNLVSSVGLQAQQDVRPTPGANAGGARQIKSLRSARPTWQKRDSSPAASSGGYGGSASVAISPTSPSSVGGSGVSPMGYQGAGRQRSRQQSQRGRIILFVIGGVTFSEIRAAQEIAIKHDREVIVGSTHVIAPEEYLRDVSSLTFKLVADDNVPVYTGPSYLVMGYGCPPHVDPLVEFDRDVFKKEIRGKAKKSAQKGASIEPPSSEPRRGEPQNRSGRDPKEGREYGYDHQQQRGNGGDHSRSGSRNANRPQGVYSHESARSHGSAPPPQQRGNARLDSYANSSSGSSMNDYQRHQDGRSNMRSSSGMRGGSEGPPRGASNSRDHYAPEPESRTPRHQQRSGRSDQDSASHVESLPAYKRTEPQNFRAGYEEYRQQQQQQQQSLASRSKSLHSTSSTSSHGYRSSPQPQNYDQQPQMQSQYPPQSQLSKEDLFRAKLEKSNNEWNAQRSDVNFVNTSNIPDMHKVTLAQGSSGNGRRARSGSSASAEKKASGFFKRYL